MIHDDSELSNRRYNIESPPEFSLPKPAEKKPLSQTTDPSRMPNRLGNGGGINAGAYANSMTSSMANLRAMSNATDFSSGSTPPEKKNNGGSGGDDSGGLFEIFLKVLTIPEKFGQILGGMTNAGLALTSGVGGIVESAFLGLEDLIYLAIFIITLISKYLNCFIMFIVNLPSCFTSHILTVVFGVLYLIFPLTAFIVWMGTGFDLMPYYDQGFDMVDSMDDSMAEVIGFHLTKFPPSIIKQCYTCNNKVIRLRDIVKDVGGIREVGAKIAHDLTVVVPEYMKPAMPFIYKTADYIGQAFLE